MSSRLVEFLEEKAGAIEILSTIDAGGTRFGELVEVVGVSHDTVAVRLGEAEDLGLVQRKAVPGERRTINKWALTGKGARIRRLLEELGFVKHYRLIQTYRKRIEESEEEFLAEVRELEQTDEFDSDVLNEKALHNWKRAVESRNPDESDVDSE